MNKACGIFLALTLFFSCDAHTQKTVAVPDSLRGLLEFPLPEGYTILNDETGDQPLVELRLRELTGTKEYRPFSIDRQYLIPQLEQGDFRRDLSPAEISGGNITLTPLREWDAPGQAARVNGLTPADSDYPLVKNIWIEPVWNSEISEEDKQLLSSWLEGAAAEILRRNTDDAPPRVYWIAAVGDIMLQRGVEDTLTGFRDGPQRIFSDLLPAMQNFNLLLGNLEGAVTTRGVKTPKSYNFRFDPRALGPLKTAGFDYVSVTNNHCYDYGEQGFIDTLDHLADSGIATSGAGRSTEEALKPAVFTIEGREIRILSMGAYPAERNGFDGKRQAQVSDKQAGILWYGEQALSSLKEFGDAPGIDIVLVHGGHEWHRSTDAEQRNIYRSLIDAGAELVFGSHPHVLQGAEQYKNGLIYYSLGNFVFNGMQGMPHAEDSMIAAVGICAGKILYRSEIGVKINGPRLGMDTSGTILKSFQHLSAGIPAP